MPNNVLTLGATWADLFENSLARKLAGLEHFDLGNPKFHLSFEQFLKNVELEENEAKELYLRLCKQTTQSSELLFKFGWYVYNSKVIFIDNKLLDTALGHHILILASQYHIPAYAVGVSPETSPLAPAFLKGIIYPSTPDDLVEIACKHLPKKDV